MNIDHDHACCPGSYSCGSCVRGLLCWACNVALGIVKDDPDVLKGLLAYLGKRAALAPLDEARTIMVW